MYSWMEADCGKDLPANLCNTGRTFFPQVHQDTCHVSSFSVAFPAQHETFKVPFSLGCPYVFIPIFCMAVKCCPCLPCSLWIPCCCVSTELLCHGAVRSWSSPVCDCWPPQEFLSAAGAGSVCTSCRNLGSSGPMWAARWRGPCPPLQVALLQFLGAELSLGVETNGVHGSAQLWEHQPCCDCAQPLLVCGLACLTK